MEENTIADNLRKQQKKSRNYPKRMYRSEAEKIAIVLLRDCGGMSMITITRLLGHSDISKLNIMKVYSNCKDKYRCLQCQQTPELHTTKTEIE